MAIIGAHVSAAGGAFHAFENAQKIGATSIQIFVSSPRQWKVTKPSKEAIDAFKQAQKESGLGPVFAHASYLVNLASADNKVRYGGLQSIVSHLTLVDLYGITGLIFHLGSSGGGDRDEAIVRMGEMMQKALAEVPGKTYLIMENSSGGGGKLGSSPEEMGAIYRAAKKNKRIKVCIDTAHAFEAGEIKEYTKKELDRFVERCDKAFGWKNVVCLHLNDSKTVSGSNADRHENIGMGEIGIEGFRALAKHSAFNTLPWMTEVPGFDDEGSDKKNMDIVKGLFKKKNT